MSEFQDKVSQYKQTIVDSGFTTGDDIPSMGDDSPINDVPTIRVEDSSEETPQESHQEVEHKQKDKKVSGKTVSSLKRRLEQVTYEKSIREAQTQELMARVQEQERRLAEQQALLEQSEQYKNTYYENNLQTRESAILNELKTAKEEGDIDKEIALSKELAKIAADQSTYGLYKSQLRNQSSYDQQNIYPQPTFGSDLKYQNQDPNYLPQQTYEEPYNEAYDAWLEKNPWADPESRNFSPRLVEEANKLVSELDDMLRYNGDSDRIGTSDYYNTIDNLMSERYGIRKQEQRPRESQESQYSNVAPVSRNGSSMADQYMARNPDNTRRNISLTEDEYKIARNLQIKLPDGRWRPGGDEALRRYMEAKKFKNPNGSQKITIE